MRIFTPIYNKMLSWSRHPHAPFYLGFLSFIEASFFPIPPDVMLGPMSLAEPSRAWRFAAIATFFSVLGGLLGYLLGMFFISMIIPLMTKFGYLTAYHQVQTWFNKWGFWILFCAGIVPIPYKLFTIASGAVGMPLLPFVVASVFARGCRFYIVSAIMRWSGARGLDFFQRYIDLIGWILLLLVVLVVLYFQLR